MENQSTLETILLRLELMSGFISSLIRSNNTHKKFNFPNSTISKNLLSSL